MTIQEPIPNLWTERLELRGPKSDDFPVYRDFFADAEASRFYGGPMEADRAWRVLATDLGHWALRGYGRWSVIERATGSMIGGCGLWWPAGYPRSELTWWITPSARRHGYSIARGTDDLERFLRLELERQGKRPMKREEGLEVIAPDEWSKSDYAISKRYICRGRKDSALTSISARGN